MFMPRPPTLGLRRTKGAAVSIVPRGPSLGQPEKRGAHAAANSKKASLEVIWGIALSLGAKGAPTDPTQK